MASAYADSYQAALWIPGTTCRIRAGWRALGMPLMRWLAAGIGRIGSLAASAGGSRAPLGRLEKNPHRTDRRYRDFRPGGDVVVQQLLFLVDPGFGRLPARSQTVQSFQAN